MDNYCLGKGSLFLPSSERQISSVQDKLDCQTVDCSQINDDLESALACMDLLDDYIGVSNTNVHLTASQGKSGRILIPSPPEWRWMCQGNSSPWMPNFQLYRQDNNGSWDNAINRLKQELHLG